ncbi:MAG: beta-lactamase family protein [Pseudomonadota bacterium]|nr:beta-lactamase family protein [Pseudomonadota bacterium]
MRKKNASPKLGPADTVACQVIDTWLDFRSRWSDLPGFQVAIRRKGELVLSKACGFASLKRKTPYTTGHVGHIASHSKMFTACLALMMQARGLLDLMDPVVKYLPQLKKHQDRRFRDVTLRDLLSNRSGLFRDGTDAAHWDMEKPFPSREELQKDILSATLVYEPDTHTKYSNTGFGLMGLVLEAAGGKPYDTLVREYILDRIPEAQLLPDYTAVKGLRFADGHSKRFYGGERRTCRHDPAKALASATGFCGTMESTTLFLHTLLQTDTLLPRAVRNELQSLHWPVMNQKNEHYGLGLIFDTLSGQTWIGHSGGWPGFVSQTRLLAGSDLVFGVIINTNEWVTLNVIRSMEGIIRKIADTFSAAELKNVAITPPLMNKWGAWVYVTGQKKAIGFPLETWLPMEEAVVLEARQDGSYSSDAISGWHSPGEPVRFIRRGKDITAMKSGAFMLWSEKEYLKRNRAGFVS